MKIAILGAGALGCYYGARLAEAGEDVSFIMRSDYDSVREHGIEIKSVNGDISLPSPQVFRSPGEVGPVDLAIVAWKTTSNNQLADALPPLVGPDTLVLTLQNGMGNAESIAALVDPTRVFVGMCFICAMKSTPGEVRHLEGGDIQFAPFASSPKGSETARKLSELFNNAHVPSKAFDHSEQIQWFKLVWNIPFNGLCLAKGGISIAELYQNPDNVTRARKIMEEVVRAAKARGYSLPDSIVDFQMGRTEKMGAFVPSSAVDYNMGRPIEYEAIWGIPLAKARHSGTSTPEWDKLDTEIRARIGLS